MAGRRSNPGLLSHGRLVAVEAVLLIGATMQLIQTAVMALHLPNWGKVLWVMASTAGLLGALVLCFVSLAKGSLVKVHAFIQALPVPTPLLLVHGAIFVGLFLLYAYVWRLLPLF